MSKRKRSFSERSCSFSTLKRYISSRPPCQWPRPKRGLFRSTKKLVMNNATANVAINGNALLIKPILPIDLILLKPLVTLITSEYTVEFHPNVTFILYPPHTAGKAMTSNSRDALLERAVCLTIGVSSVKQ